MRQIICFYLNLQYQALFGLLTAPLKPMQDDVTISHWLGTYTKWSLCVQHERWFKKIWTVQQYLLVTTLLTSCPWSWCTWLLPCCLLVNGSQSFKSPFMLKFNHICPLSSLMPGFLHSFLRPWLARRSWPHLTPGVEPPPPHSPVIPHPTRLAQTRRGPGTRGAGTGTPGTEREGTPGWRKRKVCLDSVLSYISLTMKCLAEVLQLFSSSL